MKWKTFVPLVVVAAIAGGLVGCSQPNAAAPAASASQSTPAASAVLPVDANPIVNTSTTLGLSVTAAAVEDNVDPATGKAIADRLQLTIANSTDTAVTGLEIYYVMTDTTTKTTEGYYLPLDGVTIAPKSDTTVFFDNKTEAGHFPENTFSLYRSSVNQVDFTVDVSAPGLQIAQGTATKGAGTGEAVD